MMEPQQTDGYLEVERRGDTVIARFLREVVLGGVEAEVAAEQLTALLAEPGQRRLLIDFGNVRSLSSLMLSNLIVLHRAAGSAGMRLALFNLRPDVRGIMEITRLNLVPSLYDDEAAALQSP